jgi:heme oxygenase
MAALEADLRFFFGQDWPPQIQPNEGTQAYCDRLREVCFSWPGGFVAHHYTRYMGDLSGGQMIAKAVERSYDLQERRGTQFYVFDRIGDLSAFKNQYRANLDAGPWDDAEKQRIVEEVLLAYRLNARLLAAL